MWEIWRETGRHFIMYVFSCVPHYSWPHMLRNIHAFIFVFVCVCLCINIWHCKEWLYYKSKGNLIYRDIVQCMHFPISMEQWNKWSIVTRKCLLVSIYEIAERLRTVEHQHRVLYRFYRRPVSIKKKTEKAPKSDDRQCRSQWDDRRVRKILASK